MNMLHVRFDIGAIGEKYDTGAYGSACYEVVFRNVAAGVLHGCRVFMGDSRATLSGRENVCIIGLMSFDKSKLQQISEQLSQSSEFMSVAANNPLEFSTIGDEPLVQDGVYTTDGRQLTGWGAAAYASVQKNTSATPKVPEQKPEPAVSAPAEKPAAKDGIFDKADATLRNPELQERAKALLLYKLYKFCSVINPAKAAEYLQQLQSLTSLLSQDEQTELSATESAGAGASGDFAAKIAGMVNEALKQTDDAGKLAALKRCEECITKRIWPFGKQKAWLAVINGWLTFDRKEAFRLLYKAPLETRKSILLTVNKAATLQPSEWEILEAKMNIRPVIKRLIDDGQPVSLNAMQAKDAVKDITVSISAGTDEDSKIKEFEKYEKLLSSHKDTLPAEALGNMANDMHTYLATSENLETLWNVRFGLLHRNMKLWINNAELDVAAFDRVLQQTPDYLKHFLAASYFSSKIKQESDVEQAYSDLSARTSGEYLPEACFLHYLIWQKRAKKALELAQRSKHSKQLIPGLRKELLFYTENEEKLIKPQDVTGDQLSEFLVQTSLADRVEYLKRITDNGNNNLPECIWIKCSLLEMIGNETQEDVNPMYASIYMKSLAKTEQFATYLRLLGYGVCQHKDVDLVLMITLKEWAKTDKAAVKRLMGKMKATIMPSDNEFQYDIISNAVFERCRSVFCAVPEFFVDTYLEWFNRHLVNDGIKLYSAEGTSIIRYKGVAVINQALLGATAISEISSALSNRIIVKALTKFKEHLDENCVEFAAQIYNSDLFDIAAPVNLPAYKNSWQTGVIKKSMNRLWQGLISVI
ncbi:MAG: hypothetical protein LBH80_08145 [Prevotellaceae bacterium]|jgi:hypothetical protein|nr:hypothetical protein [Prevotellaceae bacterium]